MAGCGAEEMSQTPGDSMLARLYLVRRMPSIDAFLRYAVWASHCHAFPHTLLCIFFFKNINSSFFKAPRFYFCVIRECVLGNFYCLEVTMIFFEGFHIIHSSKWPGDNGISKIFFLSLAYQKKKLEGIILKRKHQIWLMKDVEENKECHFIA